MGVPEGQDDGQKDFCVYPAQIKDLKFRRAFILEVKDYN